MGAFHRVQACALISVIAITCACAAPTPTLAPDSALAPSPFAAMTIAPDAPAALRAGCPGWPADVVLSFVGWATLADLGLPEGNSQSEGQVYAIVTRDRISQFVMIGSPIAARGICWAEQDGLGVHETGVADDWKPGGGE